MDQKSILNLQNVQSTAAPDNSENPHGHRGFISLEQFTGS
jgi:hypothetical protein